MNTVQTIRPFKDDEVYDVFNKMIQEPFLQRGILHFLPHLTISDLLNSAREVQSKYDFQQKFIGPIVQSIINQTSKSFTYEGIDNIDPHQKYLFISNHRDIVLDSAILNYVLHKNNIATSQIAIGSNLVFHEGITAVMRLNKCFVVNRNTGTRAFYEFSKNLSNYIRSLIEKGHDSVWIAQREGRAKDGNDETQQGLLKMLTMSGEGDFLEKIAALNIVPVTVSYQYDPCIEFKARELYHKYLGKSYTKSSDEDYNNIITGITGDKGKVHLAIGKPLNTKLKEIDGALANKNQLTQQIALLLDQSIHEGYQLWEEHYIAYDLLYQSDRFVEQYGEIKKAAFEKYIASTIQNSCIEKTWYRNFILKTYAFPLENKII